jgi:hypothetical protein
MQHNIRLAHGGETSGSDKPLQVRHLPNPSAGPYSVPGMTARLTETATPSEVAGIIEEVNGALVGVLPQLTELVAAAADWTRVRLAFDDPHRNPTFEAWTRLAAAHGVLRDFQEQLENSPIPGTTRWSTSCGPGNCSATSSAPARSPIANRQRAARTSSPQATAQRTTSPAGAAGVPASTPLPSQPMTPTPTPLPNRSCLDGQQKRAARSAIVNRLCSLPGPTMPAPRTSAPSTTTGSDALLYLLFGILGIALAFGSLAWLTGNISNSLFGSGPRAPFRATDALLHPDAVWPNLSPTAVLVAARIIPGLLSVCLTILGLVLWMRLRDGAKNGLARKADLAPLLDKEITAKARSLRPSLSDRECERGSSC